MPKRILITGACGFVGHHFVEHFLKTTDWKIVILDGLNYAATMKRLTDISVWEVGQSRITYVPHDIRFPLNKYTEKQIGEVDYILHLAAESHVDQSIKNPRKFVETNVIGTLNMLELVQVMPDLKKFIYFSTDEVFGPIAEGCWSENARHAPGNPYSATKAGAEDLCLSFANTYKLPIIITNTMNIFGERQHPEKFIPLCIRKILNGEKVLIHADQTKTKAGIRFYLHARNAAEAIKFILEKTNEFLEVKNPEKGRFNIVGEKEIDNLSLAQFIAKVIGKPLNYEMVDFHGSRPGHDLRYGLCGEKLTKLGFKYPKTFEDSLTRTIRWTLKHPEWL